MVLSTLVSILIEMLNLSDTGILFMIFLLRCNLNSGFVQAWDRLAQPLSGKAPSFEFENKVLLERLLFSVSETTQYLLVLLWPDMRLHQIIMFSLWGQHILP